jgi:hypothetical protein
MAAPTAKITLLFIILFFITHCKDNANRKQSPSLLVCFAEMQLILCKDNANRKQSPSLLVCFAEMQLILCKDNANRAQSSSSLECFAEMQLILCKDNHIIIKWNKTELFFQLFNPLSTMQN